jgi:hypothetical protein
MRKLKQETKGRFSKATVAKLATSQIKQIQKDGWKFNSSNGWAQVDGRGETASRAYGRYRAFTDLLEWIRAGEL